MIYQAWEINQQTWSFTIKIGEPTEKHNIQWINGLVWKKIYPQEIGKIAPEYGSFPSQQRIRIFPWDKVGKKRAREREREKRNWKIEIKQNPTNGQLKR